MEHMQRRPASQMVQQLTPGQLEVDACGTCRRIVRDGEAQSTGTPADAWLGFIARHLKRKHCTAPRRDLEAVAALLVETGPPDDPVALELFEQIKALLLTPMRVRTTSGREHMRLVGLREALAKLPPRSGNLALVAAAMRCWRSVMGRTDLGHFRSDRVIEVMLQVAEPEAYLQHLKSRGLEPLGVAFHPNVLERAKKEPSLRGLFGGGMDYWKRTADQLNVVTD